MNAQLLKIFGVILFLVSFTAVVLFGGWFYDTVLSPRVHGWFSKETPISQVSGEVKQEAPKTITEEIVSETSKRAEPKKRKGYVATTVVEETTTFSESSSSSKKPAVFKKKIQKKHLAKKVTSHVTHERVYKRVVTMREEAVCPKKEDKDPLVINIDKDGPKQIIININ